MKILGISAGTKNGIHDALVKEALLGAQEQGAEVEFVHLLDLKINPCTGCCACVRGKTGALSGGNGKCIFKNDDYPWLEEKMLEADGIILGSPIFEKGLPGIVECLSDRGGPSHNLARLESSLRIRAERGLTDEDLEGPDPRSWKTRHIVYISVGGSDWVKRVAADCELFGILPQYRTVDNIVFPWGKRTLLDDSRIERVHEAGVALAKAVADPDKAEYLGDPGICPNCHSRLMYLDDTAEYVTCLVCDIRGKLTSVDGKWKFSYTAEELERAHNRMSGLRIHAQETRENEMALLEAMKTPEYAARRDKYVDMFPCSRPEKK